MMTVSSPDANNAAGPHGNTSHQLPSNLGLPFEWSEMDNVATDVGSGDDMDKFQTSPSYSLQGQLQESTQHPGLQCTDAPDLWQAPVNFEWDQWAAYLARFSSDTQWT
jgi:hypothetical protein